ncbi:rhomboid family intramembrane serine protease [Symmachiella dynata]|uniref:rhomboid family intramembrane serine protease n=1 Tax=Symmachiella dynata TaxID=2527995 RepID=UPI0030EDB996
MGFENRDYARSGNSGGYGGGYGNSGGNWAINYLLVANIAIFLLQQFSRPPGAMGGGDPVSDYLSLSLNSLEHFQVWRIVTYGFCHGGFQHIFFNMFVLWMFGRIVEPIYGSKEFLAFYLTGIVISGLCHVAIQLVDGSDSPVIGASGGVNAVVFLCAMLYPRMTILFMFVIPIEFRFLAVGYALIDLFGVISPGDSVIAHAAHLGGAAFGVAYKYFGWRIMPLLSFGNWKMPKRRPKPNPEIRPYRPPESPPSQNLDSRVDEILIKIQEQGEASLTDEERKILTDASKKYKNRP